jgi:hypothetical protein
VCKVSLVYTAEPLVPGASHVRAETAIARLKKYKYLGSGYILAEIIQARGGTLVFATHRIINLVWNKEEYSDQWKESIIVPVNKKSDKIDCNDYCGISLL